MTVLLGYEVGTGKPVEIPIAHTFVTGQTQLSGKTTTLRAIVERSGLRALAFVTKRGETFEGRRIRPYLPRESREPIHWRLVETILAAALGQRAMKYERYWLIQAAKGATSLAGVRDNVVRLLSKAKGGRSEEAYTLIREYLDLVVPDMRELNAAEVLEMAPGLNVMDVSTSGPQLQALVVRAALEQINRHEEHVLTVFPEAWEFAPRGRSAPAKDEAIAMVRKGAVLGNFLLCDSQDIAGVETTVRQGCSVWILGVQRELNELKRTIQMIPAGIKRPKPEDVATLELGQFYACWGRHALKVYVQPTWVSAVDARAIAMGTREIVRAQHHTREKEHTVDEAEARALRAENQKLRRENEDLRRRLEALEQKGAHDIDRAVPTTHADSARQPRVERASRDTTPKPDDRGSVAASPPPARAGAAFAEDDGARYQAFKARLIAELPSEPALLAVLTSSPEIEVRVRRHVLEVDGDTLRGRIARLIADDFFSQARTSAQVLEELMRRGADRPSNIELGNEMKALCDMGFFTRDNKWYSLVPNARVRVVEKEFA